MLSSEAKSILDALLIAERLEASIYAQGLESGVLDGLSDYDRSFFKANVSEEYSHAVALETLGATAPEKTFYFPLGTFRDREKYLSVALSLEEVGISAYSAAIYQFSRMRMPEFSLYAAKILGIEAEHRVLIRVAQKDVPPNNLCFEVVTSVSVAENAKALTPFLSANQFCGESTGPICFPERERVRELAGRDYCRNPLAVPGIK